MEVDHIYEIMCCMHGGILGFGWEEGGEGESDLYSSIRVIWKSGEEEIRSERGNPAILLSVGGLPLMTSAKFSDFLKPLPPCHATSLTELPYFVRFSRTPSPPRVQTS